MLKPRVLPLATVGVAADRQGMGFATTQPAEPEDVLDADALNRLRELDPKGQNRLVERVMQAYLNSLDRLLPQLDQARCTNDWNGVRHIAHTLKSSSASIGAMAMSELCASVERCVREEQLGAVPMQLLEMDDQIVRVRAALERMLGINAK